GRESEVRSAGKDAVGAGACGREAQAGGGRLRGLPGNLPETANDERRVVWHAGGRVVRPAARSGVEAGGERLGEGTRGEAAGRTGRDSGLAAGDPRRGDRLPARSGVDSAIGQRRPGFRAGDPGGVAGQRDRAREGSVAAADLGEGRPREWRSTARGGVD